MTPKRLYNWTIIEQRFKRDNAEKIKKTKRLLDLFEQSQAGFLMSEYYHLKRKGIIK